MILDLKRPKLRPTELEETCLIMSSIKILKINGESMSPCRTPFKIFHLLEKSLII